jgi:hypothetical protein
VPGGRAAPASKATARETEVSARDAGIPGCRLTIRPRRVDSAVWAHRVARITGHESIPVFEGAFRRLHGGDDDGMPVGVRRSARSPYEAAFPQTIERTRQPNSWPETPRPAQCLMKAPRGPGTNLLGKSAATDPEIPDRPTPPPLECPSQPRFGTTPSFDVMISPWPRCTRM